MLPKTQKPTPIYSGVAGRFARAVDAMLGVVAPRLVHRMQRARMQSSALLAYEGAQANRLFPRVVSQSADAELLDDLASLRGAARSMVRDDAHGAAIAQVLEENIVGTGLLAKPHADSEACGMTPDQCDEWVRACERVWRQWSAEADATEHGAFEDLQAQVLRSLVTDGEALAHMVSDSRGQLAVELVDVDRLESPGMVDTDRYRGGVEIGVQGQAVAYHVLTKHPDDVWGSERETVRIPKWDGAYQRVQHVFRRHRPGQHRGVPPLSSALNYTRGLHDYLESELTAARANSKIAMFIRRPATTADPDVFPVQPAEQGGTLEYHERLESGTIEYLNEGEEIAPFIPNRPGTQFDPFVVRSLRAICASMGLAYELVAKDLGSLNYSASRALLLECRRSFDMTRRLLVRQFCEPWYRNVIMAAVARGEIVPPARGRFFDDPRPFLVARWVHPAYGWVDPTKEVQASRDAVEANLSTPYDEAQRSGLDAEQVLLERARFLRRSHEIEREHGLPVGSLTGGGGGAAVGRQGGRDAEPVSPAGDDEDENSAAPQPQEMGA